MAVVMRLVFTAIVTFLLQFEGVKLIGGILLLWIVYKLYQDVIKEKESDDNNKFVVKETERSKLSKAILTVALADITLSLDNVLGVAGAAKGHYWALMFGLTLSIIIMATLANFISIYIICFIFYIYDVVEFCGRSDCIIFDGYVTLRLFFKIFYNIHPCV